MKSTRFDANHWRGMVCRFSNYRARYGPGGFIEWETLDAPEPGESCAYSDLIPDPDGRYFVSEFLSGSNYSGCSVERANYRDFLAEFGKRDGVHEVYGGHGTYAVAVRLDAIDEKMAELFDALEDYPVLDEESLSELELESQQEAWDSWAESDFVRELERRFDDDGFGELVFVPDCEPEGQTRLFETGERPKPADFGDAVRSLFEAARELANEYWIDETGGNAWIDLDRVAGAVTADLLTAHGLKVEC